MQNELDRCFDAMERQRAALESDVLALNEAQLNWAPSVDVWSTRQIIEHLVLSDETVGRAYETGAVPTEASLFRVLPRAWRRALILSALRRGFVLPLPSPDIEPQGDISLPVLLSRWEAARAEMRRALETMHSSETRFGHPVLGPLTALQMLELGQTHIAYHTRQMESLHRNPAFPQ